MPPTFCCLPIETSLPNRREELPPASAISANLSQRAGRSAGQPISALMQQALAHPELISLAAGFVDQQSLPVEPTRAALEALLSEPAAGRAALQYGTNAGYPPLREQLLARLAADDGAHAARGIALDQVVVTAGSNELLHLLVDTLCDPGAIILCAAPSYFVFLGMAANLGVTTLPVETDDQGLIPEALEEQLARLDVVGELPRVKAIYVVSYFDNPAGVNLSAERRPKLVEIARRWSRGHRIYILEDVAYRELRYAGDDLPSIRAFDSTGETVVLTHTFSKSYSPGIRVGYGVLPRDLVEPVLNQKGNIDFGSSNFCQHLMSKVLELGLFDAHVQRLRDAYRVKLQAMLDAADRHLAPLPGVRWIRPTGGLYVWLQLDESVDTGPQGKLFDRAVVEGVLYVPGQYCFPSGGPPAPRNLIRLSFGVQSPERICQGIAALARAIRSTAECAVAANGDPHGRAAGK
jgi:2-aminoadipate transaminase